MSRTVSGTMEAALYAQQTTAVFITLLAISHADFASTIRLSSDGQDTVSNGETYLAYPFQLQVATDEPDRPPEASLTVDAVDRVLTSALRDIVGAATVTIQVVLAADPDTVEVSWENFSLRDVVYNAQAVSGRLTLEEYTDEPWPAHTMGPTDFPALF